MAKGGLNGIAPPVQADQLPTGGQTADQNQRALMTPAPVSDHTGRAPASFLKDLTVAFGPTVGLGHEITQGGFPALAIPIVGLALDPDDIIPAVSGHQVGKGRGAKGAIG